MAFCELHYFSPALQKQTAANILLPEGEEATGPFCVFYLLHGLSDDHTIWQRRTSIERYVAGLPLIVVMPDGGRGFYTDAQEGMAYETAIVRDLVNYVDRMFPTKAERGGRCIGGLSMGGYGAIKLALKHPHLFGSANSHSGAMGFGHRPLDQDDDRSVEFRRIVGADPAGGPNDLYSLAEKSDRKRGPALRIDCGTEDFLIDANRAYHRHLESLGFAHEYVEYPGEHDWAYWDLHVQEALAFHRKHLKI
ncbi:MAG TPA: alpha/beta hydrolase family protein [Chthonomonadaceae bacterium]|nr:alpha/beta hydrolase family protein [Chthonomonadaceae bacterium]